MSSIIVIIYCLTIIIIGVLKKVNCYDSFLSGSKEGVKTVINMYSYLVCFVVVVNLIKSCGIIEDLKLVIKNTNFNPLIIVQAIIRPFSASSSMAIMLDLYNETGVDSFPSIFSSLIHTLTDSSFYIITFYLGYIGINKSRHLIPLCTLVHLLGFVFSIIIAYLLTI